MRSIFCIVKQAKKCGFSIVSDLLEIHLSSISCPIFDSNGFIIATIGLAFPTGEIEKNKSDILR